MKHPPSLASVMTPFPYSIESDQGLEAARTMMRERAFHHLPVTAKGKLVGLVSERDLRVATSSAGADPSKLQVGEIASEEPYLVDIALGLEKVVSEMAKRRIDSAVVLKNDKLVGIFTHTDVAQVLADMLDEGGGADETA